MTVCYSCTKYDNKYVNNIYIYIYDKNRYLQYSICIY